MRELTQDSTEIDRILSDSADKAQAIAAPILKETTDILGFWQK